MNQPTQHIAPADASATVVVAKEVPEVVVIGFITRGRPATRGEES